MNYSYRCLTYNYARQRARKYKPKHPVIKDLLFMLQFLNPNSFRLEYGGTLGSFMIRFFVDENYSVSINTNYFLINSNVLQFERDILMPMMERITDRMRRKEENALQAT